MSFLKVNHAESKAKEFELIAEGDYECVIADAEAAFKLNIVAKAVQIPHGKDFKTIEEYRNAILYKPVRVKVVHEESEYQGEKRTQARVKTYNIATIEYNTHASANPFDVGSSNPNSAIDYL